MKASHRFQFDIILGEAKIVQVTIIFIYRCDCIYVGYEDGLHHP